LAQAGAGGRRGAHAPSGRAMGDDGALAAAGEATPDGGAEVRATLRELAEVRRSHHEKFREREAQAAAAQAASDAQAQKEAQALAQQIAGDEEEARLRQLEADEAYSRQLAEELNALGGGNPLTDVPLQDFHSAAEGGGNGRRPSPHLQPHGSGGGGGSGHASAGDFATVPLDESDNEYHPLEDDEYQRPMRTGYIDRLMDPPEERFRMADFGDFHRQLLGQDARALAGPGSLRSVLRRNAPQITAWGSLVCLLIVLAMLVLVLFPDESGK